MDAAAELAQLTELCRRLGADAAQADVMARQLQKRADQLAAERGETRETAMARLLRIVIEGRQGRVADGDAAQGPKAR